MPFWKKSEDPWDYAPERRDPVRREEEPPVSPDGETQDRSACSGYRCSQEMRDPKPPVHGLPLVRAGDGGGICHGDPGRTLSSWDADDQEALAGYGAGQYHAGRRRGRPVDALLHGLALPCLPPDGAGGPWEHVEDPPGGEQRRADSAGRPPDRRDRRYIEREKTDKWHSSISNTGPWAPARPQTP